MSQFLEELERVCKSPYWEEVKRPLWQYVAGGEKSALVEAKKRLGPYASIAYWLKEIWRHLPTAGDLCAEEKRAMRAAVVLGREADLATWLQENLAKGASDDDVYVAAYLEAFGTGKDARIHAAAAINDLMDPCLERPGGQPNAAGRFLLSLSDEELVAVAEKPVYVHQVLPLLLRHAAQRMPAVLHPFLYVTFQKPRYLSDHSCRQLLSADARAYEQPIAEAAAKERNLPAKAGALAALAVHFPDKYLAMGRDADLAILTDPKWFDHGGDACRRLAKAFGASLVPEIGARLLQREFSDSRVVCGDLGALVEELGEAAAPALVALARDPDHDVRLAAVGFLVQWPHLKHDALIQSVLAEGLGCDNPSTALAYLKLVAGWHVEQFLPQLWRLFGHKSKPVRAAAVRAIGRLGEEAVQPASDLLAAKKAAVRGSAVMLLAAVKTPAAAQALEARLDDEPDEEVRDQILLALETVWEAQGRKVTRKEIDRRVERAGDKLAGPVAEWIAEDRLPPLRYAKAGEKLTLQAVRYLLFRQSRAKEIRADVECKPLHAILDHGASGDFALALLEMFCRGPMAAEDRWALAVAGLLGDDRVVPVLLQQIHKWVDGNRGKMAEYAAEALALLGTDTALCAVDALSIRYRSKQKNIGKAASEAFAEAAQRLGITVDELGDRVVPWLGFEPGKPRVIEQDGKRIEVRIGLDFKIEFRDLVKGKKIAALPSGISAEVKSQFKDLGATLREVLKGQLARLENLMVRQFRWPLARWRELYLAHPLLFPFAVRLVWGLYRPDGTLETAFRALEDRSCTNEQDEAVLLPEGDGSGASIGIVHPLELSAAQRRAWAAHLADYQVESPFLQMERPVVCPAAEDRGTKISSKYNGTELNGMTFKGRAERLGWQRGSVVDAGGISCYRKCFPGAGADAILWLDGMYIGIDMYTDIKLERFCFVRSGSVSFGSYQYDEPANDQDPRLLAFDQVPPVVFSETLGDLAKIAGQKESAESQT